MRRYNFLSREFVYEALNKLRAAFLAANNGSQVESIIKGVLTHDERMKVGRRIQIAQMIKLGVVYEQIAKELKVGKTTVLNVARSMEEYPECFELINRREEKVEKVYGENAYKKEGGPKLYFKKKSYTGFKRSDVGR